MHNVYIVQYIYLATEQAETYRKLCIFMYLLNSKYAVSSKIQPCVHLRAALYTPVSTTGVYMCRANVCSDYWRLCLSFCILHICSRILGRNHASAKNATNHSFQQKIWKVAWWHIMEKSRSNLEIVYNFENLCPSGFAKNNKRTKRRSPKH